MTKLACRSIFNKTLSVWYADLTGTAGDGDPPVMSVGAVSSKCMAAIRLVLNSGTEEKALTKLAASTAATVPAGSAVEARIG
jgi:hypothetical protein